MKLTVAQYSKKFKMSKEIISSKIRAKKLDYIVEDSIVYIITKDSVAGSNSSKAIVKPKTTVATVLGLYQRENKQLKEKIIQLETKIDKLIDDKEQMLRYERDKIEELYSSKDEQLKNILELINTKLSLEQNPQVIHDTQTIQEDKKISQKKDKKSQIVELKEYLKTLDLKSYQRKIIKKRFLAVYDSDIRIIQQNGRLYLDFEKYDYSDLLEY